MVSPYCRTSSSSQFRLYLVSISFLYSCDIKKRVLVYLCVFVKKDSVSVFVCVCKGR